MIVRISGIRSFRTAEMGLDLVPWDDSSFALPRVLPATGVTPAGSESDEPPDRRSRRCASFRDLSGDMACTLRNPKRASESGAAARGPRQSLGTQRNELPRTSEKHVTVKSATAIAD